MAAGMEVRSARQIQDERFLLCWGSGVFCFVKPQLQVEIVRSIRLGVRIIFERHYVYTRAYFMQD